jgi:predicted NAD/FAD-dependent oxidoreductase
VSWIAVNSHKPQRKNRFTLMVHSSAEYAEAYFDDSREKVIQHLISETSRIIQHDVSSADYKTVHGWRYANNLKKNKNSAIFLDHEHKIAACGDWCLDGRVEGAFTSAYNLTLKMKESVL